MTPTALSFQEGSLRIMTFSKNGDFLFCADIITLVLQHQETPSASRNCWLDNHQCFT